MNQYRLCFCQLCSVIGLLMVLLLISGCSGITPDGQLRNNREEGPESGLFSGPDGEFVIFSPSKRGEKKPDPEAGDTAPGTAE
jgi:hypothetical protein